MQKLKKGSSGKNYENTNGLPQQGQPTQFNDTKDSTWTNLFQMLQKEDNI
jgi:hypothetical protein